MATPPDWKEGTFQMWNDTRGFGFIKPNSGEEGIFVHRSTLSEDISQPASGDAVLFQSSWDDQRKKERATSVKPKEAGASKSTSASTGSTATPAKPSKFHVVSDASKWNVVKEPLAACPAGRSIVQFVVKVRSEAPKASGGDARREEFQIVGDENWDRRLFPAGPSREEVVVLKPDGPESKADMTRGKGHGRNWAVEGKPGASFRILLDAEAMTVACEEA